MVDVFNFNRYGGRGETLKTEHGNFVAFYYGRIYTIELLGELCCSRKCRPSGKHFGVHYIKIIVNRTNCLCCMEIVSLRCDGHRGYKNFIGY